MFRKIREYICYFICKLFFVSECFELSTVYSHKDIGITKEEFKQVCESIDTEKIINDFINEMNF